MRGNTIRAALLIGMVALATEVAAAGSNADAAKINAILDRWQVVEATKGGDVALWRDMMGIQLKMVSPSTLDRLLALNTGDNAQSSAQLYQNFIYTLGTDIALRLQAKKAQAETKAQAEPAAKLSDTEATLVGRVEPKTLGALGVDQVFTPITPCRVVDTRNVGGKIGAFATRNFYYYTILGSYDWGASQGGVAGAASTVCPGTFFNTYTPSAAVATVIVTGQGGAGNLIVWQGTNPLAPADTLSYPAAGDTSTLADIPWGGRSGTGPGGGVLDFGVYINAFTSTNVVVDIVGYYSAPAATALDCLDTATVDVVADTTTRFFNYDGMSCPATYNCVGPHIEASGDFTQYYLGGVGCNGTAARAYGYYIGGSSTTIHQMTRCCRIPGH